MYSGVFLVAHHTHSDLLQDDYKWRAVVQSGSAVKRGSHTELHADHSVNHLFDSVSVWLQVYTSSRKFGRIFSCSAFPSSILFSMLQMHVEDIQYMSNINDICVAKTLLSKAGYF